MNNKNLHWPTKNTISIDSVANTIQSTVDTTQKTAQSVVDTGKTYASNAKGNLCINI